MPRKVAGARQDATPSPETSRVPRLIHPDANLFKFPLFQHHLLDFFSVSINNAISRRTLVHSCRTSIVNIRISSSCRFLLAVTSVWTGFIGARSDHEFKRGARKAGSGRDNAFPHR